MKNTFIRSILSALVFVALVLIGAIFALDRITRHGKELEVPDYTGMSVYEARKLAESNQMHIEVVDSIYVRNTKRGYVVKQNPECGSKVKSGRRIMLTINARNAKMVSMPNLVGYSLRSAMADLSSRGLEVNRLKYIEDIATNNVLGQQYKGRTIAAGEQIASGSGIDLILGINSEDRIASVPSLEGLRYRKAVEKVHESSLNVGRLVFDPGIRTYQDSTNAVVYKQVPSSRNTVGMGYNVRLYLTLDEDKVAAARDSIARHAVIDTVDQNND